MRHRHNKAALASTNTTHPHPWFILNKVEGRLFHALSGHNTARMGVMSMTNLHCWPIEYRGQVQPSLPVQACQCLPQHGCFICQLSCACQDVPWGLGGCRPGLVLHLGCKREAELLCLLSLPATVLAQPSTCQQTRFCDCSCQDILRHWMEGFAALCLSCSCAGKR